MAGLPDAWKAGPAGDLTALTLTLYLDSRGTEKKERNMSGKGNVRGRKEVKMEEQGKGGGAREEKEGQRPLHCL